MLKMKIEQYLCFVLLVILGKVFGAISHVDQNVQNTITEEERRGAASNEHARQKTILDNASDKKTRGIHSVGATHKHHHYFVPSGSSTETYPALRQMMNGEFPEYDTHLAATGHGFDGGVTSSGHDFGGHGSAPSAGDNGPHAHLHHHHHGHSGYGGQSGYGGGYSGGSGYGSHGYGHSSSGTGIESSGHSHGGHGGTFSFGSHGGGGVFHNGLALKSLLIPLAGIALLGAAAALTTNPVLLQLGVVNGRRRRRSTPSFHHNYNNNHYPANPYIRPDGAE